MVAYPELDGLIHKTDGYGRGAMLNSVDTATPLFSTLTDLIAVDDFEIVQRHELQPLIDRAAAQTIEVVNAAFDLEIEEALEDAHRALYALYADRVWRAPRHPRPAFAQAALDVSRGELEQGLRHHLARRRNGAIGTPPENVELAEWMQRLALGPHPHEDPTWGEFIRESISLEQLKQIVINRSLFFLREPDPWIFAVPKLRGIAKAGLIDLMLDEYGWGKLDHMHSSVYARLMEALELQSEIDHYEAAADWRFLATLNHQWMLGLNPELNNRLLGTIYLTEADSPGAMTNYLAAWARLGIDDPDVLRFYEIHVSADENHRDVALHEVVLPVCEANPDAAKDVARGIFDARTLEADFAAGLRALFESDANHSQGENHG